MRTYEDISSLIENGKPIDGLVKKWNQPEVEEMLEEVIKNAVTDDCLIFKTIIQALKLRPPLLGTLYRFIVRAVLTTEHLPKSLPENLVDLLQESAKLLGVDQLSILIQFLNGLMQDDSLRVVHPKPVSLISTACELLKSEERVPSGDSSVPGSVFVNDAIREMMEADWDSAYLIHVVSVISDLELPVGIGRAYLKILLEKCARCASADIPAQFFHILRFSCKKNLHSDFINLSDKFMLQLETKLQGDSNQVMGTCMVHLMNNLRLSTALVKQLMTFLSKNLPGASIRRMSVFMWSMMLACLSMTHTHRMREQIEDMLKKHLLDVHHDVTNSDHVTGSSHALGQLNSIDFYNQQSMALCKLGVDKLLEGMVAFGFFLLDHFAPKAPVIGMNHAPVDYPYPASSRQRVCEGGIILILELFARFDHCRDSVLLETVTRIFTKASSEPVFHLTSLFHKLIRSAPLTVFENVDKLCHWLDYIPTLPSHAASSVLQALRPVVKVNRSLRDSLIPILRKAHRSRHLHSRETAVVGCVALLRSLKMAGGMTQSGTMPLSISLSQITAAIHIQGQDEGNSTACFELMASVKRALTQQASVRRLLYQQCPDIVRDNPSLAGAVLDLIQSHFTRKCHDETARPTINFDLCSDEKSGVLVEPVADLVNAISVCFSVINGRLKRRNVGELECDETAGGLVTHCNRAHSILENILGSMSSIDISDLEVDRLSDLSSRSVSGQKQSNRATLAAGVYQSLVQWCFLQPQPNPAELADLFTRYIKLHALVKDKKGFKEQGCLISINTLKIMVDRVVCGDDSDQNELRELSEDLKVKKSILCLLEMHLNSLLHRNRLSAGVEFEERTLFPLLEVICVDLVTTLISGLSKDDISSDVCKQVLEPCAMCIDLIIKSVIFRMPSKLDALLRSLVELDNESPAISGSPCFLLVHTLQSQLLTAADNADVSKSLLTLIMGIIISAAGQLKEPSEQQSCAKWFARICMECTTLDVTCCKQVLSTALTWQYRYCSSTHLASLAAQHVCFEIGQQDDEGDGDSSLVQRPAQRVKMVVAGNAETLAGPINGFITQVLDNCDWLTKCLTKLVLPLNKVTLAETAEVERSRLRRVEDRVLSELHSVMALMQVMNRCSYDRQPNMSHVISNNCLLYNHLAALAHYFNNKVQIGGSFNSQFERVIKASQGEFKEYVYATVTYAQEIFKGIEESGNSKSKKLKKKDTTSGENSEEEQSEDLCERAKSKVIRDTRTIPQLIFAMEQFEKVIFQLSKTTKSNLSRLLNSVTTRDFRIKTDVRTSTANQNSDNIQNQQPPTNDARDQNDPQAPPARRSRRQ